MKEQLKTLKDIKFVNFGPEDNWTSQKQIRKAVIKWIKEDIEEWRISDIIKDLDAERGREIHNFIVRRSHRWQDRFNITEEDLKNADTKNA